MNKNNGKIFIVDPELRDFRGHYYNYDRSLATEAIEQGFETVVLGSCKLDPELTSTLKADRVFSKSIWVLNPHPMLGNAILHFYAMVVFFLQLRSALHKNNNENSILFFPTLLGFHLLPIALLLLRSKYRAVLLFRYQADFYRNSLWAALGFRLLEKQAEWVSLVSDSHRLALEVGLLTGLPVDVVPIPHTSEDNFVQSATAPGDKPLRFVFLGEAREEKGIAELCAAIEQLQISCDREFFLQINNPDTQAVRRAIAHLRRQDRKDVHFIESQLSAQEYQDMLTSADILLMPYRSENYRSRTSGLFAEAVAAGKPTIVANETWLSEQAQALDTGIVCADSSSVAIGGAIERSQHEIKQLTNRARKAQEPWIRYNNPKRLLRALADLDFSLPDYLRFVESKSAGHR